jgi:DnaJ-domain-containing protein 1
MVERTVIAKVAPLDQHIDQDKISDPYDILGVPHNVSDEDLKQFYRTLCSENHPDRVQSSGLSPQFVEMANSRMVRINDAYQRILAMRRKPSGNGRNGQAEPDPFD